MSLLPSQGAENAFMTHRDFAALTGMRPDNIKRTMETMQNRNEIAFTQIEGMVDIGSGAKRQAVTYRINERDSYILMSKLNPAFTAQLADHWKQTKNVKHTAIPDFENPAEAARAWAEQYEAHQHASKGLIEAHHQLEEAAPAVEFVEKYVDSRGLKTISQVAKGLNANRARFTEFLEAKGVCYREYEHGKQVLVAYSQHIQLGRCTMKAWTKNELSGYTVKFTPKGIVWIADLWTKHCAAMPEQVPHLKLISEKRHY